MRLSRGRAAQMAHRSSRTHALVGSVTSWHARVVQPTRDHRYNAPAAKPQTTSLVFSSENRSPAALALGAARRDH